MLVIVSDLHFCDATAVERNVQPDDLRMLMEEIYALAAQRLSPERDRRQLDIVLLGDIFDLLRTERWFIDAQGQKVPPGERPWGSVRALELGEHDAASLQRARAITDEMISVNSEALSFLRGEGLAVPPPVECQVRRHFIPGNHDRLFLHDPQIQERMRAALSASPPIPEEGFFLHRVESPRYGVLCRHGHQWDPWNFEAHRDGAFLSDYTDADHLLTPIGDPITTELVARLPRELRLRLLGSPVFSGAPEIVEHIYRRMQRIEDVRPLLASFRWIFYEASSLIEGQGRPLAVEQKRVLQQALSDTLSTLSHEFHDLEFYQAWHDRHDRIGHLDRADMLAGVLRALRLLGFGGVQQVLGLLESTLTWLDDDPYRKGAATEDLRALGKTGLRAVVYGHTHEPLQVALRAGDTRDLYFNSGTWRRRQFATDEGSGFIGWQTFSYLVFYDPQENPGSARKGPAYEHWTGTH